MADLYITSESDCAAERNQTGNKWGRSSIRTWNGSVGLEITKDNKEFVVTLYFMPGSSHSMERQLIWSGTLEDYKQGKFLNSQD